MPQSARRVTAALPLPPVLERHESGSKPARRATAPEQREITKREAPNSLPPLHEAPKASKTPAETQLRDGEAEAFRHLAHSIVSRTLALESEYRRREQPELDENDWKLAKRQDQLRVFKRRALPAQFESTRSESAPTRRPMVVCVGSMEGTVEDVLYGLSNKSRGEMEATASLLNKNYLDGAVLARLDTGSDSDPFRQLAIKWILSETFGDPRIVSHRDLCVLEAMGMGTDAQGQRYGYHLFKSVDVSWCPPLPESSDVVRANVMMCSIFRQTPGTRGVDVYAKGLLDLGGDLPNFLALTTTCSMMLAITSANASAEAKRLTLLRKSPARPDNEYDCAFTASLSMSQSPSQTLSPQTSRLSTASSSSTAMPRYADPAASERCCVCSKKPAMASLVGATHRSCGVCDRPVCGKCHVKRKLLARPRALDIACCKVCLLEAKAQHVDPRDPCPVLP